MAKNAEVVTSAQVDNLSGPLFYNADLAADVTASTDFTGAGWTDLGYGSTDGASIEQSADSSDRKVWGATLGSTYSNFKDVLTVHMASFLSTDLLKIVWGAANVTTDTQGVSTVKVKSRQGSKGTFVLSTKTDTGKPMLFVYRGQTDPNVSYDLTEDDIISYDLKITGIASDDGTTSTMILSTPAVAQKSQGGSK